MKDIVLSGEEQICVILKSNYGSWEKFEKKVRKKLGRGYHITIQENANDTLRVIKQVRNKERKHKVRFLFKETLEGEEKIFYKEVN